MRLQLQAALGVVALSALAVGCDTPSPALDADADVDANVDTDISSDAHDGTDATGGEGAARDSEAGRVDVEIHGGPFTNVVAESAMLLDRVCDFDGDGSNDNVLADLGSPLSEIFAGALDSILQGSIEDGSRTVLHAPWVDDIVTMSDDDFVLLVFGGEHTAEPNDTADDFDGDEPFFAESDSLDACGEPIGSIAGAQFAEGRVAGSAGAFQLPFSVELWVRGVEATGIVEPGGGASEWVFCGYSAISDLGQAVPERLGVGHSLLELFLAGGALMGIPSLPGVTPNVDLDGDGLERFVLGTESYVERCIDGDATAIEGRDCWRDERMADAFALVFEATAVSALFEGREPGWERKVEGECAARPEESLFDAR